MTWLPVPEIAGTSLVAGATAAAASSRLRGSDALASVAIAEPQKTLLFIGVAPRDADQLSGGLRSAPARVDIVLPGGAVTASRCSISGASSRSTASGSSLVNR